MAMYMMEQANIYLGFLFKTNIIYEVYICRS